MIDLKSMTLQEITSTLQEMGEPAFRGKQVFTWLHKGARSFDEMTNLSKSLREKLKEISRNRKSYAPSQALMCWDEVAQKTLDLYENTKKRR